MWSKTILIGRLGSAPEMRYTADGQPVTNVSIAVDEGYGEHKTTIWYRVAFWGKTAEAVNQYCGKGDLIMAEGSIREPRIWTGRDGAAHCSLEMTAHSCKFLAKKREHPTNGEEPAHSEELAPATAQPAPATAAAGPASDEDVPW